MSPKLIFYSILLFAQASIASTKSCSEVASAFNKAGKGGWNLSCAESKPLGAGASATAYKLKNSDGKFYVGKVVNFDKNLPKWEREADKERYRREVTVLDDVKHPNVILLHQTVESTDHGFQLLEFANQGTLGSYIKNHPKKMKDVRTVLKIFRQLLGGLRAMLSNKWAHTDLKTGNVVMNDGHVKIIDFDHATKDGATGKLHGTPYYIDPRYLKSSSYVFDEFTDVHALGVILYEMVNQGAVPYTATTQAQLFGKIKSGVYKMTEGTHWMVGFLIRACLTETVAKRPSIQSLIEFLDSSLDSSEAIPDISLAAQTLYASDTAKLSDLKVSISSPDKSALPEISMVGHDIVTRKEELAGGFHKRAGSLMDQDENKNARVGKFDQRNQEKKGNKVNEEIQRVYSVPKAPAKVEKKNSFSSNKGGIPQAMRAKVHDPFKLPLPKIDEANRNLDNNRKIPLGAADVEMTPAQLQEEAAKNHAARVNKILEPIKKDLPEAVKEEKIVDKRPAGLGHRGNYYAENYRVRQVPARKYEPVLQGRKLGLLETETALNGPSSTSLNFKTGLTLILMVAVLLMVVQAVSSWTRIRQAQRNLASAFDAHYKTSSADIKLDARFQVLADQRNSY